MLERKQLVQLLQAAMNIGNPKMNFNFNGTQLDKIAINETARQQLKELIPDYNAYRENWPKAFALIEEALSPILPARAAEVYRNFAEVRTFGQGDRPVFTRKVGQIRAKQFVTRVGLAGRYEVFKLGEASFEMKTSAIGTACQVSFEELLDGRADLMELSRIVLEGMDELIYKEIAAALMGAVDNLPAANRVAINGFNEAAMDRLITVASAYGNPVIYCTREFAVNMIPTQQWSEGMKDSYWNNGYLPTYKGCPVIILPQTFTDETNSRKVIDPGYAWVIPNGSTSDKPVKVAFEGTMHMRDEDDNDDWSHTLHYYQKVGVGVILTNNLCSYVDTNLQGKLDTVR